jgi:hypothetical protein
MESETIVTIKNCVLKESEIKETKDKVFVLLTFDKKPKELDVPDFINRGCYGA